MPVPTLSFIIAAGFGRIVIGGAQRLEMLARQLATDQPGDGEHNRIHPRGGIARGSAISVRQSLLLAASCLPPSVIKVEFVACPGTPRGGIGDPPVDLGLMPSSTIDASDGG